MGYLRVLMQDYIKAIFNPSKMEIAKAKHGQIVNVLDRMRADHREGRSFNDATPIEDEFVLLFCERKGYCKYLFTGGNFQTVLTDKGIEVLEYMNYDSYLMAKWWRKFWDRISIPISIAAILVSWYVGWFKPDTDTFKDYGEPKIEQLKTTIGQLSSEVEKLKTRSETKTIETVFYVDTSGIKKRP